MNTHPFSFKDMITSGWRAFKAHWKFIWLAGLATLVIQAILQAIQNISRSNGSQEWLISLITIIFAFVIGIMITLGWSKVFLGLVRSQTVGWDTFKTESKAWIQFIKVSLWVLGYVAAFGFAGSLPGIILSIIGVATHVAVLQFIGMLAIMLAIAIVIVYFSVAYQFTNFVILDYPELASREAFRKAGAITKGNFWKLLGFAIVLAFFNLLGLICLVIGLAVTIPVSKIALAKVYEHLKQQHGHQA